MNGGARTVLWWGRFDPDYSRNRILRQAYLSLGWQVADFHPLLSPFGDIETLLRRPPRADLVHVPCFRQRDMAAAARYARRRNIPLLIDPLISAYDKQVYERGKFMPDSAAAQTLRDKESDLFRHADIVLADTDEHARFYSETLGVPAERIQVVYVGAEEALFQPAAAHAPKAPLEVLFFGSFIPLQGAPVIVEAARRYRGPAVRWVLLGNGPQRAECMAGAAGLDNVVFENWVPYAQLPARLWRADVLLGVFGRTPKTQRVIPNKVFQALACGKPLITATTPAYPEALRRQTDSGIAWVAADDADALAVTVATLAAQPDRLGLMGQQAHASYRRHFAADVIREQLRAALERQALTPARG